MTTPSTITRDEMFAPLLVADPSFLPHWQAFLEDWADDAELLLYLALGELARHLAYQLRAGEVANFEGYLRSSYSGAFTATRMSAAPKEQTQHNHVPDFSIR